MQKIRTFSDTAISHIRTNYQLSCEKGNQNIDLIVQFLWTWRNLKLSSRKKNILDIAQQSHLFSKYNKYLKYRSTISPFIKVLKNIFKISLNNPTFYQSFKKYISDIGQQSHLLSKFKNIFRYRSTISTLIKVLKKIF